LELQLIALAVTFSSVILYASISLIQVLRVFEEFSRSAVLIDWLLSLVFAGGVRLGMRILADSQSTGKGATARARRVLIVGAGDAGALVAREMQKNAQVNLLPIGFLDDDPDKIRQEIHGVKVLGTIKDLPRVVDALRVDEVILAIPSASGQVMRVAADLSRLKGVPYRTMPGLNELIGGKVSVNRLREVEISDLLRREPVHIDDQLVGASLGGKRVLVTGAGGSIGRELCRQIARREPGNIILLGHGENSIFEILLELQEDFPQLPIHPVIADVRNAPRLEAVFQQFAPQVVFHAAAHKHVPLMQSNPQEAISNNVFGTQNVVEASLHGQVERLVLISTDKAVHPSSIYGATKRLAELLVLEASHRSGRAFSVVRFGNVLGSRGSIIPLFKRQIAAGGPVTITHPDMERYFMTIPEAVHLVLQAFAMGQGGEVFVLNMGEQVRILDLAQDLIRLSGLEPGKDVEITFTGIRPGEKLSEALWDHDADYACTAHPDVLRLHENELNDMTIQQVVDELKILTQKAQTTEIVHYLNNLLPGASIQPTPPPDLTAVV
jgi:FlaA1/EpsC-like NDP-sugar epimerase